MKCGLVLLMCIAYALGQANVVYKWKSPDFVFPNEDMKQRLIESGAYVPNSEYILDVDRARDSTGRTFVTLPRFSNGTKVTLATVHDREQQDNPLLKPYPGWDWYREENCDGLTSVFRIKVDECNRLWALDSGVVDVFGEFIQRCPPKLMVFDLDTDTVIARYTFPQEVLEPNALLINIEVEVGRRCRQSFAYIADVGAYKLIVYNMDSNRSWLVNSSAFYPDSKFENFSIAGSQFQLDDGLFALTLSPRNSWGQRNLFFHALASNCESAIQTSALKNRRFFGNRPNSLDLEIRNCFGKRKAQSAAEAMDSNGYLFSSNLENNAIDCWKWGSKFQQRQVVRDDTALQFVSGMKAVRCPKKRTDEIWAIACRFQLIYTTGLDRNEYNFYIVKESAQNLAQKCRSS